MDWIFSDFRWFYVTLMGQNIWEIVFWKHAKWIPENHSESLRYLSYWKKLYNDN